MFSLMYFTLIDIMTFFISFAFYYYDIFMRNIHFCDTSDETGVGGRLLGRRRQHNGARRPLNGAGSRRRTAKSRYV